MALNDRQTLFVEEYCKTFNRTQAAIAAGYSPKTARAIGAENLTKPDIAEAIRQRLNESAMTADEVLKRLAEIARGDLGDMLTVKGGDIVVDLAKAVTAQKTGLIKLTQKTTRTTGETVIEDVVTSIELHDPLTALNLIGKNHKLFIEKAEVTGADGGPLEFKDTGDATERILSRISQLAARVGAGSSDQRGSTDSPGQDTA